MADEERILPTPAERFVARNRITDDGMGKPLSQRALLRQRSVEGYLRGENLPRYITRARDIEKLKDALVAELQEERELIRAFCERTGADFAAHWTSLVEVWDFREVNELIAQHNEWYPIERDLPMDPRTGEYLPAFGIDFRRTPVDAAWALARVPA